MKSILHVPVESFGFVEVEYDSWKEPEDLKQAYNAIKRVWEGAAGLPTRDFQAFLINMLLGQDNHVEQVEQMNDIQRIVVNEAKKALATIKRREN